MNEQEQKIAKGIIGMLVFVIAFLVLHTVGLPSFAVSYVNPKLSSGPFDVWTMITSMLAPAATAYVVVSTRLGSGVVTLVAMIINRIMSPAAAATVASPEQFVTRDELKLYARKTQVVATIEEAIKPIHTKVDQHDLVIQAWESDDEG